MPASIGVNLRVTGNCRQGGRKYMEDCFSVAYQQTEDEKDLEYAFFGIYDGHGGVEAASFAKEHLMETIIKHKNFWSDNDEDVLRAIKDGYIATHYAMWREQSKWPKTSSGLPSTAGTTASVAFIRRGKIYIGHVGDSGIILGYQEPGSSEWKAKPLTKDHKPESPEEMKRIESCGGKVVSKSGVPRVVWNRPKIGHQGPVRRSTPIDEIPFLAVARSLGDLWSYNSQIDQFVVSPDPDCSVLPIDTNIHRCLIFGTDGLYNMLSPSVAVHIVQMAERHNECEALSDDYNKVWLNPSKLLVEKALERWHATKMRADNTSAVTLMLDPPGPPRAQVLKDRKKNLPESGLKIMTRYDECGSQDSCCSNNDLTTLHNTSINDSTSQEQSVNSDLPECLAESSKSSNKPSADKSPSKNEDDLVQESINTSQSSIDVSSNYPLKERNFAHKLRESTSFDPREPCRPSDVGKENNTRPSEDNSIQINEISSSNIEESIVEEGQEPSEPRRTEKRSVKRKSDLEEMPHQRKSLRLSLSQKFLGDSRKPAPCTLAEEKLKKLAEDAEKIRKEQVEHNNNERVGDVTRQLSITQKILTSKKIILKKQSTIKSRINKRKIKLMLLNMLPRASRNRVAPKAVSPPERTLRSATDRTVKTPAKTTEAADNSLRSAKNKKRVITGRFKRQSKRKRTSRFKDFTDLSTFLTGGIQVRKATEKFLKPSKSRAKNVMSAAESSAGASKDVQKSSSVRETRNSSADSNNALRNPRKSLVGSDVSTKANIKGVAKKGGSPKSEAVGASKQPQRLQVQETTRKSRKTRYHLKG